MRVLLAANASYVPPRGGATRANLVWLDQLAQAGHTCRIVAATLAPEAGAREQIEQERIDGESERARPGVEIARRGSIQVWSVDHPVQRARLLREQIDSFRPDWVLISSEDLGHTLLREAQQNAPGRVVYLAHTPQFFPFGPASWNPDPQAAAWVRDCAGVVVIGRAMADYIASALGRSAAIIHPPIYGSGPFANHAKFGCGLVTMINPCAVKGLSIFLELAGAFPDFEFGALPGWGTTAADRRELARRSNVRLLPNSRDIDEPLSQTCILLMPSLWYEGFGLIVMESLLRGLPVIASDSGGLVEAKEGTGYVIPVRGIERYEAVFDERAMPLPVIPPNDLRPWKAALAELLTDADAYRRESERSRAAANRFHASLDAAGLERYLVELMPRQATTPAGTSSINMESLSPEKRALLLERLRRRQAGTR